MENFIQEHNKKLSYLKYRIGDSIRHQLKYYPDNSIVDLYYKNLKNLQIYTNKSRDIPIYYDLIYDIVMNSQYISCPKNSIIFNPRVFEWFKWNNAAKININYDFEFIEKNKDLITKLDNIFILFGTTVNENIEMTNQYIDNLINFLKKYNKNVYILNSNNCDQDFKYIITADYYVPSMGGFSLLGAALNKNTVFWDLADKYYNSYTHVNEKTDFIEFKNFQTGKFSSPSISKK